MGHTKTGLSSTSTAQTMIVDPVDRKLQRKMRAASQANRKENRMAHKGKPTRKHTRSAEAERNIKQFESQQAGDVTAAAKKRSDKLARQLQNLIKKDAQWEKLSEKADALAKAQYREARVADFGCRSGHKMTAPRVARRSTLIAAC